MAGSLLLAGNAFGQVTTGPTPVPAPTLPPNSSTTTTMNCPGNIPACEGDCIFTISVISQAGDSCEANRVDITFQANSTGTSCTADFDRASGGDVEYELCDGEKCKLDDSHFPDNSFWPPYVEGDGRPKPPGKDSLSQACFDAISIRLLSAGPPFSLFSYRLKGIKSVDPDFGMNTYCYCNGDTIQDTIIVKVDTVKAEVVDQSEDKVVTGDGKNGKFGGDQAESGNFAETSSFAISNIYPNPASDELNVVFQSFEAAHVQVVIHNQMGQQVKHSIEMLDIGDNLFTLDVSELKNGFYYMTAIGQNGDKVVMKFIHR